jgi:hypothetical protein
MGHSAEDVVNIFKPEFFKGRGFMGNARIVLLTAPR